MPSVKAKAAPTNYMCKHDGSSLATDLLINVTAHQQYQNGMRKRAEKASGSFNTGEQRRCVI